MWQPLRNLISSIQTYGLLSPDLDARSRVSRWLAPRPCLTRDDWFHQCWVPPAVRQAFPKPLVDFIYDRLGVYTGLEVGRLRPSDRLLEDLQFPAICWFDWGLTLCDDVYTTFGRDITDQFDETQLATCLDLMAFLSHQLEAAGPT